MVVWECPVRSEKEAGRYYMWGKGKRRKREKEKTEWGERGRKRDTEVEEVM